MDVRRWVAAAACVPLLALAGCSDDEPQAKPQDPTTSAAPSPTATATDSAPIIPPGARRRTPGGAEAFVRHWVLALNHASATGDTAALSTASTRACETCSNYVGLIGEIYQPGGSIESDGWHVLGSRADASSAGTRVALRVEQSPEEIRYKNPAKTETFKGGRENFVAKLAWTTDGWRMERLDIES